MNIEHFDAEFAGKWLLVNEQGLDALLAVNGVNYFVRKFVLISKKTMELSRVSDNKVKVVVKMGRTIEMLMDLDQEYEGDDGFGNKVKVKASWDPATCIMQAENTPIEGSKAKRSIMEDCIITEPSGDKMLLEVVTLPDDNVVCKRYYRKLSQHNKT